MSIPTNCCPSVRSLTVGKRGPVPVASGSRSMSYAMVWSALRGVVVVEIGGRPSHSPVEAVLQGGFVVADCERHVSQQVRFGDGESSDGGAEGDGRHGGVGDDGSDGGPHPLEVVVD